MGQTPCLNIFDLVLHLPVFGIALASKVDSVSEIIHVPVKRNVEIYDMQRHGDVLGSACMQNVNAKLRTYSILSFADLHIVLTKSDLFLL